MSDKSATEKTKVCNAHRDKPATIYRECVGCELEALRRENAVLKGLREERPNMIKAIHESEHRLERLSRENADLKADIEAQAETIQRLDADRTRLTTRLDNRLRLRREINEALGVSDEMDSDEALAAGLAAIAELKGRLEKLLRTSARSRDKHYRECEEIARGQSLGFAEPTEYDCGCDSAARAIARSREGK